MDSSPSMEAKGSGHGANSSRIIRVIVCDDHALFRQSVSEALSIANDIEVIAEASSHDEAVSIVSVERPEVVLLDLEMPGVVAEESIRRMLEFTRPPRIVVVTMHDEPRLVKRFLRLGASAYLSKTVTIEELLCTVRTVMSRPVTLPDAQTRPTETAAAGESDPKPVSRPSERELQVLLEMSRGMSNRQVARVLDISEATVKRHLANIYGKLRVRSRTEATKTALDHGWISTYEIIRAERPQGRRTS